MKYTEATRKALIKAIQQSLPPDEHAGSFATKDGNLRQWFLDKLEGVVAYGLGSQADDKQLIHWVYVELMPAKEVASNLGMPLATLYRRMSEVFNEIVDGLHYEMAVRLLEVGRVKWQFDACPRCSKTDGKGRVRRGDMELDLTGKAGVEYACFQCGHREPILQEERLKYTRNDGWHKKHSSYE